MILVVLLLLIIGLAFLSMTLKYPHKKLFCVKPHTQTLYIYRVTGWSLLAHSLALAIYIDGASFGMCIWFGLLSLVSVCYALLYSYLPKNIFIRSSM